MKKAIFFLSVVFLFALACSNNNSALYNANSTQIKTLVEKLNKPLQSIDDTLSIDLTGTLDPKPIYKETPDQSVNTDIIMAEDINGVTNPGINLNYSLYFSNLISINNDPSIANLWENDAFNILIRRSLNMKYTAIVKHLSMVPIVAKSDSLVTGGYSHFNCIFYDLENEKELLRFDFHALPNKEVEYRYSEDNEKQERLEAWCKSTVWENARKTLIDSLSAKTDGTFILDN